MAQQGCDPTDRGIDGAGDIDGLPAFVPGHVRASGTLIAFREDTGHVVSVSATCGERLGQDPAAVLDRPLAVALGAHAAAELLGIVNGGGDLAARSPVALTIDATDREVDAILHRPPPMPGAARVVVVELEDRAAPGSMTGPPAHLAVRAGIDEMARTTTVRDLCNVVVRRLRELTGFDRVTMYRFAEERLSEAVAESLRPDLRPMLGVRLPSSKIRSGAHVMHETDLSVYAQTLDDDPVPLVSTADGCPPDLTHAALRVLPAQARAHLSDVGIRSYLGIWIVEHGRAWGNVACHRYGRPLPLPYEVRAAAELLVSVMAARLAYLSVQERDMALHRSSRMLADLVGAVSRGDGTPLGIALTRGDALLRVLDADGAFVVDDGRLDVVGEAPDEGGLRAVGQWVLDHIDDRVLVTDHLREAAPAVAEIAPSVAGVLGVALDAERAIVWLRGEKLQTREWGGDPRLPSDPAASTAASVSAVTPADEGLGTYTRWREVVRAHSAPWTKDDLENADVLRRHVVESLYREGLRTVRATEALQRSLLPDGLPTVPGWSLDARYEPAGGGYVGGDWFDAIVLPSGRLALVVGDVTGHGLSSAAAMGKFRTTLRAALVVTGTAQGAVAALAAFAAWTMPDDVATLAVTVLDPSTGEAEHLRLGHPPPLLVTVDGRTEWVPATVGLPLGFVKTAPPAESFAIPPGAALVLFSDGLVERRCESIRDGLSRLALHYEGAPAADVGAIVAAVRDPASGDDATLLVARRHPPTPLDLGGGAWGAAPYPAFPCGDG